MPQQRLTGSRIRERRLDRGLRQAAVAEVVGISPSYLNLIEHNRRRIGGKLLTDLARALDVEASLLTDGADREVLDAMHRAANLGEAAAEIDRAEELAARYPGWAALIAGQTDQIAGLQDQIRALQDRMAYDPQLAGALHAVISAVTAIRSSASILVGPEQLDADWQRRFHENIHNDSLRLAASSEALVTYLDAPSDEDDIAVTPTEQVEAYLARKGYHLAALEAGADPVAVVQAAGLADTATGLLRSFAQQYASDVACLPLAEFEAACRTNSYDPARLAQAFQVPLPAILRRLASLPPEGNHPAVGRVNCDAAGVLTLLKTIPGFVMPRAGSACPLWPLFAALSRPGQPIRLDVALPGPNHRRFVCYAIAISELAVRFDAPPSVQSLMIVLPDTPDDGKLAAPVGVSCRICPRADCSSRREPAMGGICLDTPL